MSAFKTKLIACIIFVISSSMYAQNDTLPNVIGVDLEQMDTIAQDSVILDSLAIKPKSNNLDKITLAEEGLDDEVIYNAKDSIVYDLENKQIHLWGKASVIYGSLDLKAYHIIFEYEKNEVLAEANLDSLIPRGVPKFVDTDENQNFDANRMRYNFKTKKGIIYDISTQYNDIYLHGSKAKFVSKQALGGDKNDYIYAKDGIFSTCDHPEPHFGIRSTKQKIVPGKMVIVGPSNLEIMGIPTPLWLPFGFFPISSKRQKGILFPNNYGYDGRYLSYGFQGLGYYLPINDYWDASLRMNYYFNGTVGASINTNYKKLYKFLGNFSLKFNNTIREYEGKKEASQTYGINWTHNQDPKAHPSRSFRASVNMDIGGNANKTQNDARSVIKRQYSSSINFNKKFIDSPFSLSIQATHNQDVINKTINFTLPRINLDMRSIKPFERKKVLGKRKWYEDVNLKYNLEAKNTISATDSTIFDQSTFDKMRNGLHQSSAINTNFKVAKYINVSPSISYDEYWNYKYINKDFNYDPIYQLDTVYYEQDSTIKEIVYDTTSYGIMDTSYLYGFKRFGRLTSSISASTKLYGTWIRSKGFLRGFRHELSPSISYRFTPGFEKNRESLQDSVLVDYQRQKYSHYSLLENSSYGSPSSSNNHRINFNLSNNFEAKYFSKKLEKTTNIKLFNTASLNTSYNIEADSLHWAPISFSVSATWFKGIVNPRFNYSWDMYALAEDGTTINKFEREVTGKLLRKKGGNLSVSSSLNYDKIKQIFGGDAKRKEVDERDANLPSFLELLQLFRINHNFGVTLKPDTIFVSRNNLTLQGSLPLTDNWAVTFGSISYDFVRNQLVYPDLGIRRNLHCWEFSLDWQPDRKTYNFMIRVTPGSSFDFLKIPWNHNQSYNGF